MTAMTASITPGQELHGKVAAVTGAASGIGFASAQALADAGARVVLIDRDEAALARACAAIGERALPLVLDLLDAKQCASLLQRTLAGVASAFVFISGGLMAARLGASQAGRSGLLVGLYYGGTGWGIVASALLVPPVLAAAPALHGWTWAWWALAGVCALATAP